MASSASPPPAPFPPLHLLIPKSEPPDPIPDFEAQTPDQKPHLLTFPSKCALKIEDSGLDSDYLGSSDQLCSAIGISLSDDQNTLAVAAAEDQPSSEQPRKKRIKGGGLVRVDAMSVLDQLQHRLLIRKARVLYESLRCFFVLDSMLNPIQISKNPSVVKPRTRADLKASVKMRLLGFYVQNNPNHRILGPVPGVNIGDVFFYRAELMVLGVHNQIQGGIGYVPADMVPQGEPIATSIVASGGYQDDLELGDDIIMYTGSGGRIKNQPHVSSDQHLERGNLALERSMNYGTEIRVIRGIILQKYPLIRVYVYDGLYRVVECRRNRGKSGYHVYIFKLLRINGQDQSGTLPIRIAREIKAKLAEQIIPSGYICSDISGGIEAVPIPLFNNVDQEEYPIEFDYVKSPDFPLPSIRKAFKACRCETECEAGCECIKRNNNVPAYDFTGILLRGRPIVYECGDTCSCPASCPNRVTQRGMKIQLEIFRSKDNIWGVRALDIIQAGSFICEFSGDMVLREETEINASDINQKRVLIDPLSFSERWKEWGDVSNIFPVSGLINNPPLQHKPVYLLDVSRRRNVACYISHSSSPNVFVQFVLYGHDDVKYPRMMIFAMENIPPLRELSIDYGVVVESGNGGGH